jgi:hypothetical protein
MKKKKVNFMGSVSYKNVERLQNFVEYNNFSYSGVDMPDKGENYTCCSWFYGQSDFQKVA